MLHYVTGTPFAVFIGPDKKVTLTVRTEAAHVEMRKASQSITAAMKVSDEQARNVIPGALKRMSQIDAEFSYDLELGIDLVELIMFATCEEMKFTDENTDPNKLDDDGFPVCPPDPPEFLERRRVLDRLVLAEIVKQHPHLHV
jgi:hypothetical protein